MTWWHPHPLAATVVRRHWKDAHLLLVADREPCIAIREDETRAVRRMVHSMDFEGLATWAEGRRWPRSWMAAVILCPGDATEALADIVTKFDLDPVRLHFYLHRDAKQSVLKGWAEAGLPIENVNFGITDSKGLHKFLGVAFNIRIVDDFGEDSAV